ncbi:MAG: hypothetical protein GXP30_00500 [Verrucomicrobia bacterium]|nr:hypothetical protein [Verrucomicrobiota bacterium]
MADEEEIPDFIKAAIKNGSVKDTWNIGPEDVARVGSDGNLDPGTVIAEYGQDPFSPLQLLSSRLFGVTHLKQIDKKSEPVPNWQFQLLLVKSQNEAGLKMTIIPYFLRLRGGTLWNSMKTALKKRVSTSNLLLEMF